MNASRLLVLCTLLLPLAHAVSPPGLLNVQGRVAVNGTNFTGTGHFKFALVDPGAAETYWTNDGSNIGTPGGEPTRAVPVAVTNGHYSVGLGDTALTNMSNPIPASLFENNEEVYLRLWFSTDPPGTFEQLSPDRRLTSSPYALHAAKADGVSASAITESMLANDAVTSAKIASSVSFDDADADPSNELQNWGTLPGIPGGFADGVDHVNDADSNPTNEIQNLSLSGNDLAISGGNSVDLSGYLRSNAGDIYSGDRLLFETGSLLTVGRSNATSKIEFAGGVESLTWDNDVQHFVFSDDIRTAGLISAGTTGSATYNRIGGNVTSHSLNSATDLFVSGELEVNGALYADGSIRVGTGLASDDDSIYFDVGTVERLFWDNSETRFEITDSLALDGPLNAGSGGNNVTAEYNFFASGAPAPLSGDIATSGDLFINRDLEVQQTIYVGDTVQQVSDRDAKERFEPVDPAAILAKVATLPITTWQYKPRRSGDDEEESEVPARHLGPVAQDFHATFAVGRDNRHIATVDADGVALAAIQGLNAKVEAENKRLRAANDVLRGRLAKLEEAVQSFLESKTKN